MTYGRKRYVRWRKIHPQLKIIYVKRRRGGGEISCFLSLRQKQ